MEKDFDEYEKEYLERVKEGKKINPKDLIAKVRAAAELEPLDFVIMGFIRNGLSKWSSIDKRLPKVGLLKKNSSYKRLEANEIITGNKKEGWFTRNFDPTLKLTEKGSETIERKIDELKEEWDKLVLLYEKKDKEKLREGMNANRSFFPLMMMMGITNGMMMGNMLGMNHMMMGDFMAEVDYAYDLGYADGSGGSLPAEGGDFGDAGGDSGGFMDGGFQPGF